MTIRSNELDIEATVRHSSHAKDMLQWAGVPLFAFAVVWALIGFGIPQAEADELSVAEATALLDKAEADMEVITSEYDALQNQIDQLQAKIDENAADVLEAQQAVLDGRKKLSEAMCFEYRSESEGSYLALLLDSQNFEELLRNIEYVSYIILFQAQEVDAQKTRQAALDKVSQALNDQRDELEEKLEALEGKKAEAERVVSDASAKLESAQDAEASRLALLAEQAAALNRETQQEEVAFDGNANTTDRNEAVPDGTPVQPDPAPDSSADEGGGWQTGVASAYGGSSDPYTPNPGTTATGAICDDNSMGVAIPISWPNYRSLFGKTVEIRYNGMTVYATVNDCGGMLNGARSLDLQPGVFKAFGFATCEAWGLRTVQFRFL